MQKPFIRNIADLSINDIDEVGGKNASLGEMMHHLRPKGVRVPDGFVVTATAYRHFLKEAVIKTGKSKEGKVLEVFINETLKGLNTKNLKDLQKRGKMVREGIRSAQLPKDLEQEISEAYRELEKEYTKNVDVAVRSSATAEDLPGASFAGQQETYLNIRGEKALLLAVRDCIASLFTDRAISYRQDKGFSHTSIALSVGIQKMVRSDKGVSGIMFTVDTESGFKDAININGTWGLGEMIVQGEVIPDEYVVFKPLLGKKGLVPIISKKMGKKEKKMIYGTGKKPTVVVPVEEKERNKFVISDEEICTLAQWGVYIEEHYSEVHNKWTPMDTEWAKDGTTGELYIVQARPETVQAAKDFSKLTEYIRTEEGKQLTKGASVGSKIVTGKARVILDVKGIHAFKKGEILVTDMTDPDWEPIMKIAGAIVTDKGGRTSHAAIISRELGIGCIVGCENATRVIKTGDVITVDTTGSEGFVFKGALKFEKKEHDLKNVPQPHVKIMMNIATPETAFEKSFTPNAGVGLAREEFIIASVGIHPNALIHYDALKKNKKDKAAQKVVAEIDKKTKGYTDKKQFYVDTLAYGIGMIGAAFYPKPVIVRFSDFKTNEYRTLTGGDMYEPHEENPMIGWRGASRYYDPAFAEAFKLECDAMEKVRKGMGLTNVHGMIPMCRTPEEGKKVRSLMKEHGVDDGELKVYVMCEIPSNILRAEEFLDVFDGMSIGSNDLTQLTLGIDRDGNERVRAVANETDPSVKKLISTIIKICKDKKKYIGICGQAPSDIPGFAKFLMDEGIESMSLNPDAVIKTIIDLGK